LNGSNREDNINQFVRDFEQATDHLRDRFDKGQRITADVQEVLNRASRIDNFMRRRRLGNNVESEWVSLRQDLNELARLSNVSRRF
jgi:CHASE3 domain sensor protein